VGEAAGEKAAEFRAAHDALLHDASVQFQLSRPTPPAKPPAWMDALGDWLKDVLQPIGRALAWLGSLFPDAPDARILLWGVIAIAGAFMLWMAVQRIRHGEWRWPDLRRRRFRALALGEDDDQSLFEAAPVRAWLREADALAAAGRFAEAAHLLLFRSVEDLARRRPGSVQPALTARELAAAPAFPARARTCFAAIATVVERSFFGGRPVDADDWRTTRATYEEFALPGSWRA
jgi:hypothetical protein